MGSEGAARRKALIRALNQRATRWWRQCVMFKEKL